MVDERRVFGTIIAVAIAVQGTYLLARPEAYSSPSFSTAFEFAAPAVWGVAFLAAAGVYLALRRPPYSLGMAAVMASWSANIGWATIQGRAASPAGWVWSACLALLLLVASARGSR